MMADSKLITGSASRKLVEKARLILSVLRFQPSVESNERAFPQSKLDDLKPVKTKENIFVITISLGFMREML